MRMFAFAGLLLLASPAAGQALQQQFDAAQALLDKGDARGAAAAYRSVLRQMPKATADPKNRTVAIIRSGLGQALLLMGDTRGAMTTFEQALPAMPEATPADRQAMASVLQYLGRLHELNGDYPKAREALQRSLAMSAYPADHQVTMVTQLTLARVSVFDQPALAIRTLDAALPALHAKLVGAEKGPARDTLGEIYALRGRVHLNRGEFAEARSWYQKGLSLAGGLSRSLSISDTRIRSDMAIVHHLLGEEEEVPRYLAYTGAARGKAEDIGYGADTPLPACGALTGIEPADMAIVEFGISSEGRVVGIQPVYATRPAVAAEFARAVGKWSWRAEAAAKLDPFWRSAIRIELRCSNAGSTPKLSDSLHPTPSEWVKTQGAAFEVTLPDAEALPVLRRELATRIARHGETSPQVLALLVALASNAAIGEAERLDMLQRAAATGAAIGAPPEVRIWADVALARAAPQVTTRGAWLSQARATLSEVVRRYDAAGPSSALAAAFARMELAATYDRRARGEADQLYSEVTSLPIAVLPDAHPIRQTALLQLASNAAAVSRDADAAALAQATGLTAEQCALADVRPVRAGGRISYTDFPSKALNWGLNGFIEVSYDIGVDGRPLNARTVMAYPPFVFSEATPAAVEKLRFQPFAAVGSKIGCVDRLQRVRFNASGGI